MAGKKSTAIVPRAVRTAKFIAVVPACAIACSGPDPILDLGGVQFGVAAVAFCCFDAGGVAADVFIVDSRPPRDVTTEAANDAPTEAAEDAPADVTDTGMGDAPSD